MLKIFLLTALIASWSGVSSADKVASVQQILSAFSGTCPSQGVWTQNAATQALALAGILDSIKNDPNCASLGAALQTIPTLAQRVAQMNESSLGLQITNLQNQEAGLLVSLSSATDPDVQIEIESTLAGVETTLASYYQTSFGLPTTAIKEFNTLSSFTSGTQVALSQLATNQSCLISHPNLAAGIASLAGSVASGMLSAGASLATAAGASIVNAISEYARVHSLQKDIDGFVDPTAMTAYQCAIESLTDSWCSAEDAKQIIKQKEAYLAPSSNGGPAVNTWHGLTLLDQELPVFINWLDEVRAGNDPTTQPEGDRQMTEFVRQGDVETAKAEALGIFNGGTSIFNQKMQEPDPRHSDAWTYERTLIDAFINKIGGGSSSAFGSSSSNVPNPLFDIVPSACAAYQLIGLPQKYWPSSPFGGCLSIDAFDPIDSWPVPGQTFSPDLQLLINNTLSWIASADQTVNSELGEVLQADARTIFQDAMIKDQRGHSAYLAINKFMDFLSAQPDLGSYYSDTVVRLGNIRDVIDSVIKNGGDPNFTASKAGVTSVYQQAQLAYGPTLFQGRLQRAVRQALIQLVTAGTGVDAKTAAMLLASSDLVTQLESVSGTSSLTTIGLDIDSSQDLNESALRGFGDTFGQALGKGLTNYQVMGQKDAGSDKYDRSRASLCLMLLAFPDWPAKIPFKECVGAQLAPEIAGGPSSIKIDENSLKLPHQKRACLYHDYLRKSDIYQNSLAGK